MKHPRQSRALFAGVLCLLVTLSACAPSASEAPETESASPNVGSDCEPQRPPFLGSRTISFPQADGSVRIANVKIPASYNSREPAPMIIAFHGLGGTSSSIVSDMQLDGLADRSGVIVVAPQGRLSEFKRSSWGMSDEYSAPDAEFVDQIMHQLNDDLCIDEHRVFAMGFSNGSIFAQKYACRPGSPVIAVAGVAGIMKAPPCLDGPVPLVYFHGTGDTVTPFEGGDTLIGNVDGVEESLDSWAAVNNCGPANELTPFDQRTDRRTWTGCPAYGEVRAYFTIEGGHRWPGGPIETWKPAHGIVEPTVNATSHSWRFFERAAQAHERAN